MNRNIILAMSAVLVVVALVGFIAMSDYQQWVPKEKVKTPGVTLPLTAHLSFSNAPALNQTANITYTLTPSVDLKVNVSKDISLPEGFIFVDSNLPTNQIMLSKGKTYKFNATLKAVETGNWMIYASPGVYAYVHVSNDTAWISDSTFVNPVKPSEKAKIVPIINKTPSEAISNEKLDVLMNVAENWLRANTTQEYEEEFKCSMRFESPDIRCYCCEMRCYVNSTLVYKYYFIIEENVYTSKVKIQDVYGPMYFPIESPTEILKLM